MGLLQEFAKINKVWSRSSLNIPYSPLSRLELFELGYFTTNDVPFRCFSIKLNPGDRHLKDVALLYNSAKKQFISLLNKEDGLIITLFENSDAEIDSNIKEIKENILKFKEQLLEKNQELRDQISKCILVERKVDETIHFSLSKELSRRVYFAIGECRERAALVPIFQNSKGADLVQLALHKWMDFAKRQSQDQPFPQESTVGLVKNFLQIKKWLKDLITKQLAGISTLQETQSIH
jgi:hypothetical protein